MTNNINFEKFKNRDKSARYEEAIKIVEELVRDESNLTANLANVSALLKSVFDYYLWVGFYLFDTKTNCLVLGPFQGKVACTRINIGKGVCGTSAAEKKTIIVEDVNKFPNHIFCDSESRSEIVVPIVNKGKLLGVLDVDSAEYSSFDNIDKEYLELLVEKIIFIFNE